MKKLLLFALLLCSLHSFAQQPTVTNQDLMTSYKWTKVVRIQGCEIGGRAIADDYVVTLIGQQFNVISLADSGENAIIKILDYTRGGGNNITQMEITNLFQVYNYRGDTANISNGNRLFASRAANVQRYFLVPLNTLNTAAVKTEMVKGQLSLGVIYFPFKYRPQQGRHDFSGAFNFGAAAAYTFRHKVDTKWTFSVLSGYSISNVNIDSASAGKNSDKLTTVNDFTALSFSGGVLVQYDTKIQAGIFIGTDLISNRNQKTFDWAYQGKPWLSIGFGVSIFSVNNNTTTATQSQQQTQKHIDKNTPQTPSSNRP